MLPELLLMLDNNYGLWPHELFATPEGDLSDTTILVTDYCMPFVPVLQGKK